MPSPVGELRLIERDGVLCAIEFSPFPTSSAVDAGERRDDHPLLSEAARQLNDYFAGERTRFELPLGPSGTAFQQQVWAALMGIGHGQTATYGDIAHRVGRTRAACRAVGTANGRNPLPIVIPCHRVIGADGTLTGYAGGMERKRQLLALEQR